MPNCGNTRKTSFWKTVFAKQHDSFIQATASINCRYWLPVEKNVWRTQLSSHTTKKNMRASRETLISSGGKKLGFADRFPVKTESSFLLSYNKNVPFFAIRVQYFLFLRPPTFSSAVSKWTANDLGLGHERKLLTFATLRCTTQPMTIKKKLKFLHLTKRLWLLFWHFAALARSSAFIALDIFSSDLFFLLLILLRLCCVVYKALSFKCYFNSTHNYSCAECHTFNGVAFGKCYRQPNWNWDTDTNAHLPTGIFRQWVIYTHIIYFLCISFFEMDKSRLFFSFPYTGTFCQTVGIKCFDSKDVINRLKPWSS